MLPSLRVGRHPCTENDAACSAALSSGRHERRFGMILGEHPSAFLLCGRREPPPAREKNA